MAWNLTHVLLAVVLGFIILMVFLTIFANGQTFYINPAQQRTAGLLGLFRPV
ncbi:MAG: hypothetical protein J4473_05970 [Candidatus Aenigmarchaeota archaeon]|nr:hypothetical protein [Candidatus Aenigmarchaeota archaeon]